MSLIRVEVRRGLNLDFSGSGSYNLYLLMHPYVLPTAGLVIPTSLQVLKYYNYLISSDLSQWALRELRLQNNEFSGSVPVNLFNAAALEVLDLRNNNFSGIVLNIMDETSTSTSKLRVLLLRNNSFQTHISEKICQLSEVGLLDLSHNGFKGAIPSCFSNMSFGAEGYERSITSLVAVFDLSYITSQLGW